MYFILKKLNKNYHFKYIMSKYETKVILNRFKPLFDAELKSGTIEWYKVYEGSSKDYDDMWIKYWNRID